MSIASNVVFDIGRFQGTASDFSAVQSLGAPYLSDLTMMFQYRVTCTQGFCGSDCSQTANCAATPAACPESCGSNTPCLNGGTCMVSTCDTTVACVARGTESFFLLRGQIQIACVEPENCTCIFGNVMYRQLSQLHALHT